MSQGIWSTTLALVGLLLLIVAVFRITSSGPRPFYGGRVTGVVGRMGSGKTLFIVWTLLRRLKAGGRVAANFTFEASGDVVRIRSWSDVVCLKPRTLCVIDEMHLWCPATSGKSLPAEVRWLLSHLRKLEIELLWISQHEDRVSAALRQQTHEMIRCKKGPRHHVAEWFTPESLRSADTKPLWRVRYRASRRLIRTYTTLEMIRPDEMAEGATVIDEWLTLREAALADALPASPTGARDGGDVAVEPDPKLSIVKAKSA